MESASIYRKYNIVVLLDVFCAGFLISISSLSGHTT